MAVDFVHGMAFYRVNWKRMRRSQKLSQLKLLLFGSLKNDLCQYASTTECAQPCAEKSSSHNRNCRISGMRVNSAASISRHKLHEKWLWRHNTSTRRSACYTITARNGIFFSVPSSTVLSADRLNDARIDQMSDALGKCKHNISKGNYKSHDFSWQIHFAHTNDARQQPKLLLHARNAQQHSCTRSTIHEQNDNEQPNWNYYLLKIHRIN